MAELRESAEDNPEDWGLMLADVPTSTAVAIRYRRIKALRLDDGVIEVRVRNSYKKDGKRFGNLWMRFVPNKEEAPDGG